VTFLSLLFPPPNMKIPLTLFSFRSFLLMAQLRTPPKGQRRLRSYKTPGTPVPAAPDPSTSSKRCSTCSKESCRTCCSEYSKMSFSPSTKRHSTIQGGSLYIIHVPPHQPTRGASPQSPRFTNSQLKMSRKISPVKRNFILF
jgi:hypothetical protein